MLDDLDQIMAVMATAFDPAWGEAWNRRQVEDALTLGNCHYFLVSPEGKPLTEGEIAAGFSLSRTGYEEEELLLLAVDPQFRRKGLGRSILDALRLAAGARGAKRLLLEMRRGNSAESLYATFGFYAIGERKDYYRTPNGERIDALTFACDID
ncbi:MULTISPECIES: GNAT family N-acetyltransferase [Novosphingobium]|uniref:GNAT family N-acetyltransferase n=1 Tax=unclassified Novosphingobium TaxID=2644732 RepID=UPI0012BFC6DF|nr:MULTISPECIES: GNAT family N-acetyltransferase [unclassified Novosphingobium]MPS69149.1 GNAT family N-acetyltransferase [Novosphingobium sp.]WRT92282.1 GNAT family N-acetyltransferase [Novosphingobium sp. RL4]